MSKIPSVKTMSLQEYNKVHGNDDAAPLYVANVSRDANVMFSVQQPNGRAVAVFIPATFAPIDLTLLATKASLVQSTDFRASLSQGRLAIVTPESAEAALKHPVVAEEARRVREMNAAPTEAGITTGQDLDLTNMRMTTAASNSNGVAYEPTPYVTQLVDAVRQAGNDDTRIESIFVRSTHKLSRADLDYIVKENVAGKLTDLCLDEIRELETA
jgi:hypothetical protein